MLLAAIEAAGSIRQAEAPAILADLADSDDEDIAEAVNKTIMMAEMRSEEEGETEWIN